MELRVTSPDELIAAVDHLMGFHVENSITVIPVTPGLPGSRVDLPANQAERTEMVDTLLRAYGRHGGGDVMVIGFADNPSLVEPASRQLRESLAGAGVQVRGRLWAGDQRWTDLDSGVSGARTTEAATRIAAEMVAGGRKTPADSRAAVDQAFIGDPEPVTRYLPGVAGDMENSTPARERQWPSAAPRPSSTTAVRSPTHKRRGCWRACSRPRSATSWPRASAPRTPTPGARCGTT